MAQTRHATGNSRPRIFASIDTAPVTKRKTTTAGTRKTKGATGTKKSTTGAGVKKTRAPATHHKRKPHLSDKIKGTAEQMVGKIERKPGKVGAGTKKKRGTDGKNSRTAK